MTADELRELLAQSEGLKLEFKREYHLNKTPPSGVNPQDWRTLVDGQKDELIKDILALTNGNVDTADQTAYLIIGASDHKSPDDSRALFDTRSLELSAQRLLEIVNKACYPPLTDLFCELIELDGYWLTVVTIPRSPFVHETTRQLKPMSGHLDEVTGRLTIKEKTSYTERTAFVRRHEGIYPANKDERRALAADKSPETFVIAAETLNVEEFRVPTEERTKLKATFVPPHNYRRMLETLEKTGRLWIVGPAGVWKRQVALSVALDQHESSDVYSIPRFVNWDQLAECGVSNATLIFPDGLGVNQYDSEKIEGEFRSWSKLQASGNSIIITTLDEVFDDARKETRLSEFVSKEELVYLHEDSFDYGDKKAIFERLVRFSSEQRIVNDKQETWALSLLNLPQSHDSRNVNESKSRSSAQLHKLLREVWLPVDIERFVLESLCDSRTEDDVFELLRGYADLEKRIHSWFLELDNSTRCFVLTLAILSGFEQKEIWSKHQIIVNALRRLDPHLSIPPLGILREAARPYVSATGPLEFTNERVWRLVARELSKAYREYFTELIDTKVLSEWSIPELSDPLTEKDQLSIRDTENIRNAIARLTGEMVREGLDGVKELLEAWARQKPGRIGKTAGIALKEVAKDPVSAHSALALLDEWSRDTTSADSRHRRWATASALGRILSIKSRFGTSEQALSILQRLAEDQDNYVASAVPQAFQVMGAALPVEALGGVLTRLAKRDQFTREEVASALDQATPQRLEEVVKLLDIWAASKSPNVRWTAIFTLLTARKMPLRERSTCLAKFFASESSRVITILSEILEADDVYNKQTAIRTFVGLAGRSAQTRIQLVTMLAAEYEKKPSQTQQFLERLQGESEFITDLPFEVHASAPDVALRILLFEPSIERLPFLARLVKDHYATIVDLIEEALSSGSDAKLDWFRSPSLTSATVDNPSLRLAANVVRNAVLETIDALTTTEQTAVESLIEQLTTTREKATEAGIKNLAELDQSLVEIQSAYYAHRYSDSLTAKQLAETALTKAHSTYAEELKIILKRKISHLDTLKKQRTSDIRVQQAVQYKAALERIGLRVGTIIAALLVTVGLFMIFVKPTENYTLTRNFELAGTHYDAGTSFEVVEETEEHICFLIEGIEKCFTRNSLLPVGAVGTSYSWGTILLGVFIVGAVGVVAFFCWIFIDLRYDEAVGKKRLGDFPDRIKKAEEEIKKLAGLQVYFTSGTETPSVEHSVPPPVLAAKK
jgi:hypothetical protein